MSKKILLVIFGLIIMAMPYEAKAKTLGQMRGELKDLEERYATANKNKNLTSSQINELTAEINSTAASINKIKDDIKTAENDITDSENKIEEKREETDELLKFLQVSQGENVYLEYIFEADSYTDFIYRYSVVSQLTDYNNNLMEELKTLIEELENKKVELNNKQSELEKKSSELSDKRATLRVNLSNYQEEGTTLEQDIADMKKKIKEYENIGCKDNEEVPACGSNKGGMINATGWNYPLTWGCVTSEYTGFNEREDWSGGGGHHAIDLDCVNEGTPVYAAANGIVARIVYRSSCGGNMVWIYHSVNGRPYTTVYMHLLSIAAYENQSVTPSTVIGYVGGGSTRSYDSCTGGTHLHFGLAYGHNAYDFNSYSFNPRNIYNFPALIDNGGGYFSR